MSKKPAPPPLFAIKGDFYASLDHFTQASLDLLHAVELALKFEPDMRAADQLRKSVDKLRDAMIGDSEPT